MRTRYEHTVLVRGYNIIQHDESFIGHRSYEIGRRYKNAQQFAVLALGCILRESLPGCFTLRQGSFGIKHRLEGIHLIKNHSSRVQRLIRDNGYDFISWQLDDDGQQRAQRK
jgi:hypothetical protein